MDHHSLMRLKALRDACQADLCKQTRLIEKWQTVSEKNLLREEYTMRQQLERLQKDKARFSLDAFTNDQIDGEKQFPESDSPIEHIRRHSFSSYLPRIENKRSFHSGEKVESKPKSRLQLKIELEAHEQASQTSLREVPHGSTGQVTKFPNIHHKDVDKRRERRKTMPADSTYMGKESRHHGDKRKRKHHSVPSIVVTDFSCDTEETASFPTDFQIDQQHDPIVNKPTVKKSHEHLNKRPSQHNKVKIDTKASYQHLSRPQHADRKKSVDSFAKGGHHHIDHHDHDIRGSHLHLDSLEHTSSNKSVDSLARGSHHHLDHHDQDVRGSHLHQESLQHAGSKRRVDSPSRGSHHYMDHHDHDTEELTSLYDRAIQTVASANEFAFTKVQDVHKRPMRNWKDDNKFPDAKQMDLASLMELEAMLKDARQYNTRKQKESDYGLHTAENRQQRRRLQFLEEILQALSTNYNPKFDPMEMLQCGYLRLSKANIERLEHMVRESGIDPGIHAHSDVANLDIWKELQELRQNEALEAIEREQREKEASGRRSRHSARRRSDITQT